MGPPDVVCPIELPVVKLTVGILQIDSHLGAQSSGFKSRFFGVSAIVCACMLKLVCEFVIM